MRPRTLTSAFGSSWVPTRSALSVTGITGAEGARVLRDGQTAEQQEHAEESEPQQCLLGRFIPATRTVVSVPQIDSVRKKSMTLTATIDSRTARPTATPTPAGPPVAL